MTNPNPTTIPDPLWRLWLERPNKAWKLGGIYADKKGYHNTVLANKARWSDNYSIRVSLDLKPPANFYFGRAIDLTMSDTEMIKWTSRMKSSALDPRDNRLMAVREFYGTLDGKTVYGLSKDTTDGEWHEVTSDKSHLWHGHVSFFTMYVNNWPAVKTVLSVWAGESFEDWNDMSFLPRQGNEGQEVAFWQRIHNAVAQGNPSIPIIDPDGNWGPATTAAVFAFWEILGVEGKYKGDYLDNWVAYQYLFAWIKKIDKQQVETPPVAVVDPKVMEQLIKESVKEYMDRISATGFHITGDLTGYVTKGESPLH